MIAFDNQEVIVTCGVLDRLNIAAQKEIWSELGDRKQKNPNLDSLQVFKAAGLKVWVIDDGIITTMLLPEEY